MSVFPYGLFAAAGVGCMLIAMLLTAPKRSFSKGTVTVFGLLAIPLSLVFSRLLYCVFQLNLFCDTYENPWLMLCIWDGGYSIWGVIPALLLAAWLTAKKQRCSFRSLWDCVSLSSALLFAMLYAGEGRTELGIGKVIDTGFLTSAFPFLVLEQKLGVNVEYRLIVYRLQCLACVVLFLVMLLSRRKSKTEGILALRFWSIFASMQIFVGADRPFTLLSASRPTYAVVCLAGFCSLLGTDRRIGVFAGRTADDRHAFYGAGLWVDGRRMRNSGDPSLFADRQAESERIKIRRN